MIPEFRCSSPDAPVTGECDCVGCRANRAVAVERAKLPDGMKHCTILFRQCEKGHGWLTATNWVDFGCPTCERDAVRAAERVRCLAAVSRIRAIAEKNRDGYPDNEGVACMVTGATQALTGVENLIKDESWTPT